MAIIKTIQIYDTDGISRAQKYIVNPEKTTRGNARKELSPETPTKKSAENDSRDQNIFRELNYDMNPAKTTLYNPDSVSDPEINGEEVLVDGYLCDPYDAATTFRYTRERYHNLHSQECPDPKKRPIIAVHLVMSFPHDDDLDPRLVHQIGMEFVQGLKEKGLGEYEAVVSTHMNTQHLHNHILLNAYSHDGKRKFHDNKATRKVLMELNDELSQKYGLPILHPDENHHHACKKNPCIGEHYARLSGESWKEQMRQDIRSCIEISDTGSDWKEAMETLGYTFRTKKDETPISLSDGSHNIRLQKLGDDYTYESIIERIAEKRYVSLRDIREQHSSSHSSSHSSGQNQNPYIVEYFEKVRRYTDFGRRRTDLEIILLSIIQYFQRLFQKLRAMYLAEQDREYRRNLQAWIDYSGKRIRDLNKALELMKQYEVENMSDVSAMKKTCGKALSETKKSIECLEKNLSSLRGCSGDHDATNGSSEPSEMSIAALSPMTPYQRRDLFLLSKDSGWRVRTSFDNISAAEAAEAIRFLKYSPARKDPYAQYIPSIFQYDFVPTAVSNEALQEEIEAIKQLSASCRDEYDQLSKKYRDLVFLEKTCIDARDDFTQMDRLAKDRSVERETQKKQHDQQDQQNNQNPIQRQKRKQRTQEPER